MKAKAVIADVFTARAFVVDGSPPFFLLQLFGLDDENIARIREK